MTMSNANDFQNLMRIDFKLAVETDPVTGKEKMIYSLDPSRYKVVGPPEKRMVYDTIDNFYIPVREVQRMVEQAIQSQPTGEGQRLGNAREYIETRRRVVEQSLRKPPAVPYHFVDHSEELLASLCDGLHGFAIVSVDLVGSTKLSNALDATTFARVIGIVLEELAAVVPYFHGQVLKFTGDGALIYFPPPSFVTANDNAIDCALTMRGLVIDAINPAFAAVDYPALNVRIGVESGGAVVMTVGHPASKRQRDLIGQTLNIACKIQASGQAGEIRVGQVAFQNLHTMWKRGCVPAEAPDGWPYKLVDGGAYSIYVFAANGAILS